LAQHSMLVEEALIGPLPFFQEQMPRWVNRVALTEGRPLLVCPD
jgi:hypothetical protein